SIDVHYGAVQALFNVSLAVHDRETVAVLGGNASGKSTTIKSVLGLVKPTKGAVSLAGASIASLRPDQIIARGVASVPEGRRIFPEMTVYENLLLGAYTRRHEWKEIEQDVEQIYAAFPRLKDRRDQLAGTMSGG